MAELSDEALDEIARRVAERMPDLNQQTSPWFTRAQAAEYLSVPVSRLEKDRSIPCRRWEGRVFYNRAELDAFMASREVI
jgi:hypothetical protein